MKKMQNIKVIHVISLLAFIWFFEGDLAAALFGWFFFTAFAMPKEWTQ